MSKRTRGASAGSTADLGATRILDRGRGRVDDGAVAGPDQQDTQTAQATPATPVATVVVDDTAAGQPQATVIAVSDGATLDQLREQHARDEEKIHQLQLRVDYYEEHFPAVSAENESLRRQVQILKEELTAAKADNFYLEPAQGGEDYWNALTAEERQQFDDADRNYDRVTAKVPEEKKDLYFDTMRTIDLFDHRFGMTLAEGQEALGYVDTMVTLKAKAVVSGVAGDRVRHRFGRA